VTLPSTGSAFFSRELVERARAALRVGDGVELRPLAVARVSG